jgi:hypothetical protein
MDRRGLRSRRGRSLRSMILDWVLPSELPSIEEANRRLQEPFDSRSVFARKERRTAPCSYQSYLVRQALALAPPAFMFALGSALMWAFRGFRQP